MDLDLDLQKLPDSEQTAPDQTVADGSGQEAELLQQWLSSAGCAETAVSPGSRAKTCRDYENELVQLRRDNFDLRMRIYLMEERQESLAAGSSAPPPPPPLQPPSDLPAAHQFKQLYLANSQLKEEVSSLVKQLAEKEEAVVRAASALQALEKSSSCTDAEADQPGMVQALQQAVDRLSQELVVARGAGTGAGGVDRNSVFDDSSAVYAMAFGLPLPAAAAPDPQQQRITALQIELNKMEVNLKEEALRRLSCDDKLDRVRMELKRSEDARRRLQDELKHRETELAEAHRLIEDKCQALSQLQLTIDTFGCDKSSTDAQVTEKRTRCRVDDETASRLELVSAQLRDELAFQKSENVRIQGENMKAMKAIQGLVKQNRALTRDLELAKSDRATDGRETCGEEEAGSVQPEDKDNRIVQLETELTVLKEKLVSVSFGITREESQLTDLSLLRLELESKNCEIENLNEELKKRTFNLQELVNKELWDKNREIEKLNQTCERKQSELTSLKQQLNLKNREVVRLQEELKSNDRLKCTCTTYSEFKESSDLIIPPNNTKDDRMNNQLKFTLEENEKLKMQVEIAERNLKEQISVCSALSADCRKWRTSAEESEKNRKELVNACTLLTTRLEELSTFLESLLPLLASKKRRMLQQAIDRSREMSRSFSLVDRSCPGLGSVSFPLLPDVSQVDFCSADETLAADGDQVTELRSRVESLVERLNTKEPSPDKAERLEDVSQGSLLDSLSETSEMDMPQSAGKRPSVSLAIVAKPAVPAQICLSESDGGWSEPDRNISKQRIGITQVCTTPSRNSSEESGAPNSKKSPGGKKCRNEGLVELKRLSAKLDCLEQMNEALHAELQVLHRSANSPSALTRQRQAIIKKPNSPKPLSNMLCKARRSLDKSFAADQLGQDDFSCKSGGHYRALQETRSDTGKCSTCLLLEERCFTLESKLFENEGKSAAIQVQLEQSLASLSEKENLLLEKQCSLLEANNNIILLNAKLNTVTHNLNLNQDKLEKNEKELMEKEGKSREMLREMEELKKQSEAFECELKSRLESCQRELEEAVVGRIEMERQLAEASQCQAELRASLDQQVLSNKELHNQLKHEERCWRRRVSECEALRAEREADLRRKLDTAVLTTSEAVLERTRLANDKLKLQHDLRAKDTAHFSVMKELERRVAELETLNSDLEEAAAAARCRWDVRQDPVGAGSSCSPPGLRSPRPMAHETLSPPLSPAASQTSPRRRPHSFLSSDYLSDQEHVFQVNGNLWLSANARHNDNCSPDLGIESDHHSLARIPVSVSDPLAAPATYGDAGKLEAENERLRRHLLKTRKALADTLSQLTSANQKKRQVERAICKQIHKTNNVLQRARVNFETDENHPPQ